MDSTLQETKKVTHTPGPWGISQEGRSRLLVNDATARHTTICQVMAGYVGDDEAHANARLIAAAPDLLAAMKRNMVDGHIVICWQDRASGGRDQCYQDCLAAQAAIAKAEGRQ